MRWLDYGDPRMAPYWRSATVPAAEVLAEAAETAIRLDHAVYDCAHLALARKRNVPLVTADHRLKARAGARTLKGETREQSGWFNFEVPGHNPSPLGGIASAGFSL
ncbi:type II toxin-antitoxin system VapC family toxin [Deferrisoma camini]|uniref:type II toxin-antitoxin system VapC family toxin n=1 Tax=Deferrisoma camini TaxID=1035120 RepID=UPI00146B6485|nr:type II toxin-antitoxin system VapC family toxin [Deferrisoma camini]